MGLLWVWRNMCVVFSKRPSGYYLVFRGELFGNFECDIDAVQGRGSDATCIACTLATGIEVRGGDRLQCLWITRQTHSTAATALYAEDNCLVGQETTIFAVEIAEALLQAFADMCG